MRDTAVAHSRWVDSVRGSAVMAPNRWAPSARCSRRSQNPKERQARTGAPGRLFGFDQPIERGAEVVVLDVAARQPRLAFDRRQLRVALFGQHDAVGRVRPPRRHLVAARCQPFEGVLAEGLEHGEPRLVADAARRLDEALVNQGGHSAGHVDSQVAARIADGFRPFQGPAVREDGEPAKQPLLGAAQQLVAPINRGAEGLLGAGASPEGRRRGHRGRGSSARAAARAEAA